MVPRVTATAPIVSGKQDTIPPLALEAWESARAE
jgi:hypothetical protein